VVCILGVPVFAASSKTPDRVKAMVAAGMNPAVFQVLDTRTGEVFSVVVGK
jgi:hypothetical protein